MSAATHDPTLTPPSPPPVVDGEERGYIINLYTEATELGAAVDMATKVVEVVRDIPGVFTHCTTVVLEDDPAAEPHPVFETRSMPQTAEDMARVWAALEVEERAARFDRSVIAPVWAARFQDAIVESVRRTNPDLDTGRCG